MSAHRQDAGVPGIGAPSYFAITMSALLSVEAAAASEPSALWNFTLTILLTPCSCMVTPYSTSAMAMVRLLCVMMMNCEWEMNRCNK